LGFKRNGRCLPHLCECDIFISLDPVTVRTEDLVSLFSVLERRENLEVEIYGRSAAFSKSVSLDVINLECPRI